MPADTQKKYKDKHSGCSQVGESPVIHLLPELTALFLEAGSEKRLAVFSGDGIKV